jgi:hypothetical protein
MLGRARDHAVLHVNPALHTHASAHGTHKANFIEEPHTRNDSRAKARGPSSKAQERHVKHAEREVEKPVPLRKGYSRAAEEQFASKDSLHLRSRSSEARAERKSSVRSPGPGPAPQRHVVLQAPQPFYQDQSQSLNSIYVKQSSSLPSVN